MPLAGNLRQASLLNILRTIALEQRDGCLTLTRGHLRAEIYFRRGQWLAAERVPVGPPLTEQFVAMGYMSPDQIEEVILVPFDEAAVLPDGQIVQALMADGLLTREQLQYWAMSDAIALVNAVLSWPDGDFSFVDGIHPPQELVLVSIPIENIVASLGPVDQSPAVQHTGQNPATIALRPDTVLTFADIPDTGQTVEISQEEWMVLAQIDGANPLGVIAATLQMDARRLVDIAHHLLGRGLLAPAAPPSPYG
ncbi:MAG TPA: DUF4388 domain-containing protein [Ktedonobacterales bacterium]|nr:DUF4388 domain-containing protein [Ktedonobacterales bacterium]